MLIHNGFTTIAESIQLYNELKPKYNFNSTLSIDCVMVNTGRFEEAEKLIGSRNDIELWSTLLGGCRKCYNIELGEKVFNKITSIDENVTSPYILLLNIYSYHGLNEKVRELQEIMKTRKTSKSPGIVYYEEHGTVFKFVSGSNNFQISEQVEKEK